MKYRFVWDKAAQRELRAIELDDARQILITLTVLGNDPYREGLDVKKLAGRESLYRLRVGRYRVIYTIEDDHLVILVVKVGWRRDIYRGI